MTVFIDSYFSANYIGATNAKLIRGAYHFAHPDQTTGAAQAEYFLAHGGRCISLCLCLLSQSDTGGWTGDGITLPGAIDLEGSTISDLLTPDNVLTPRVIFEPRKLLRPDPERNGFMDRGFF